MSVRKSAEVAIDALLQTARDARETMERAQREIETLLDRYHRPYHRTLDRPASTGSFRLGLDCHTMAATGPPVGPDPGAKRPLVCLSNADGTCPSEWLVALADCFRRAFDTDDVRINEPFRGGHIIRRHWR